MDIIYSPQTIKYEGTVIMLGNFDGLHIAHMAVIEKGMKYAKEHGLKSGVLIFKNHTRNAKLITSNRLKLELLKKLSPDFVYIKIFTEEFMKKNPEEFALMLKEKLNVRAVCVGYDYRFGYKTQGDIKTLEELGTKYDFDVLVTEAMSMGGHIISSTYIRSLIEEGDMEGTKRFLGRYFCIEGSVEKGLQNGRKLGFPTANVAFEESCILPKEGVYAGFTEVCGKSFRSVINVGSNPTFNAKKITVESHILDFSDDIYGKNVTVSFVKRLRGDIKFKDIDELIEQIKSDIKNAEILETAIC